MLNLLFDLDGTLTDPRDGIARSINYALGKFNVPLRDTVFLEQFIGPPLRETFRVLLDTEDDEVLTQAIVLYRERYLVEGYTENNVYSGVSELLSTCRESGHRLFVATYKRQDIAVSVLSHFQLSSFFDAIYGCDLDLTKTALLTQLLKEQSLTPASCLMIGDRKGDIEAGRNNGISTAGVLWGYGSKEELTAASPDYLAQTPSDLFSIIRLNSHSPTLWQASLQDTPRTSSKQ